MPRNGSGGYSAPQNSWNPAINNAQALPNDWMSILNDFVAAIQASIAADGQTPITGSLNFGGNRARSLGAPQGSGDGLRFEQLTKGPDVPSAATIAFPIEGGLFDVTGTTTITAISGSFAGHMVLVRFTDILTLTNSANLALPGGTNITTQAGDIAAFLCLDGTIWQCWLYPRAQNNAASSDHFGTTAPAITWPGMTWADSGTNTFWRRSADNATWINEGVLFQRSVPGNTFAAISALTADLGPILCSDQDGILYKWDSGTSKYVAQTADNPTALARASSTTILTPAALGFAEQPVKTGSAQFVRAANEILMTGIVTTLGLEVGDVIQITGTASNNLTVTVEKITDANDINVNYEHRNGAGPLSLTDETAANATVKLIAKWYNAPLGLGQAWVDLKSKRFSNTNYTGVTNRTIKAVCGLATAATSNAFVVNGVKMPDTNSAGNSNFDISLYAEVSPGGVYKLASGGSVVEWTELR